MFSVFFVQFLLAIRILPNFVIDCPLVHGPEQQPDVQVVAHQVAMNNL